MKKYALLFTLLTVFISVFSVSNRYGMTLTNNGGTYTLTDSEKVCSTIDCSTLPADAYQPYTYSENLIKSTDYSYCKTKTYVYKNYGSYSLSMEVDIPVLTQGPHPFIIYVHGGSWYSGSTVSLKNQSLYLASRGIAGIRITYTLVGNGGHFDMGMQELDEAFAFIAAHATEWNLDMSRFGYLGNSAGVPLAALKAMKQTGCKLLIGYNGLYDFKNNLNGTFPAEGNKYLNNYQNIADRGPLSAIEHIPSINIPAVAVFHGTADFTISSQQAVVFADSVREKGGRAENYIYTNYVHGFFNKGGSDVYEDILIKTYDFVKSVFNLPVVEFPNQEVSSVYYVSPDGDDIANSGTTVISPFKTIKKVFDIEAQAGTSGNSEFTIHLAKGTYPTSIITPNLNRPVKVTLAGDSPSTTFVQNTGEFLTTADNFRLFQLQPAENAGLELNIQDITIQNYGGTINNYAGCIVMMNGSGAGIKVGFKRCVFKNNAACRAAIIQSSNTSYEVSFDGCYFENCKSFDKGTNATNLEAPIYVSAGKLSIKNCIFNNNVKDPLFGTTDRDLKKGSVLTINPIQGRVMAILANNTFIGNKAMEGKESAVSVQPAVTIADLSLPKKAFGVDLTMINNLFVENKRSGFSNDVDLYIDPADVTLITLSNNVFNKVVTADASSFVSLTQNRIDATYTYTSPEIAFDMDDNLPQVQTAENGLAFVMARGSEIVGKGIAGEDNGEVPGTDILGKERKTTPDVGATDYTPVSSVHSTTQIPGFKIYVHERTLHILNENEINYELKISDITGRLLYSSKNSSGNFSCKQDIRGAMLISIRNVDRTYTQKVMF
ncbi:MAG: alpha/beta hydrolase [Paludibacter sp.]|nr:alpha/beta hydrolase [Paludibacter sp.]